MLGQNKTFAIGIVFAIYISFKVMPAATWPAKRKGEKFLAAGCMDSGLKLRLKQILHKKRRLKPTYLSGKLQISTFMGR